MAGLSDSPIRLPPVSDEVSRSIVQLAASGATRKNGGLQYGTERQSALLGGVRRYLTEEEGSGYWEYFKPADDFLLSVTDGTYKRNQWVHIEEGPLLKLRLLVAGQLLGPKHEAVLSGPKAILQLCSGTADEGYFIAREQETKLIVLHCRVDILEQRLGLDAAATPPPLDAILANTSTKSSHRIDFNAEILHSAQRILNSRHGIPGALRPAYLESMATTILCEILAELSNRDLTRRSDWRLQARDINRIFEVRDYLDQHFDDPPTIPYLARMVGINQTKLKSAFKQVLGLTVYQYILERRMERAAELLLTQNYDVTEIAYQVGYKYPTNFTHAFKRHFGTLPRKWNGRSDCQ